jgi:hypothetical protein
MELSEHVMKFVNRSAIKSQIIDDFVVEWMELGPHTEGHVLELPWLIYCVEPGVAVVLISPSRALAAKVLRQGFYWPAVINDVAKLVATCEACQNFSH